MKRRSTSRPGVRAADRRLVLDLGRVEVMAQVMLNGKDLGILWKPPFRLDVTDSILPGVNRLTVKVVNLWPNRLIGDEELPQECQWQQTSTGRSDARQVARLARQGHAGASGRIAFSSYKFWFKNDPLLKSGLLGPVTLRTVQQKPLNSLVVEAVTVAEPTIVVQAPGPKPTPAAPPDGRPTFNRVRFFPAPGREQAMLGGRFSGSNVSARTGFELLAEITSVPAPGQWTELSFTNSKLYRWIRYEAPAGSHGNVAELEFYLGERKAVGRHFGSFGWQGIAQLAPRDRRQDRHLVRLGHPRRPIRGSRPGRPGRDPQPADGSSAGRTERAASGPLSLRYAGRGNPVLVYGMSRPRRRHGLQGADPHQPYHDPLCRGLQARPGSESCGVRHVSLRRQAGLNTVHIGNSLTQTTAGFERFARAAGYLHTYKNTTQGGGNTKTVSNNPELMNAWEQILATAPKIDHFTVQPRFAHFEQTDFDDEVKYDLRFMEPLVTRDRGLL